MKETIKIMGVLMIVAVIGLIGCKKEEDPIPTVPNTGSGSGTGTGTTEVAFELAYGGVYTDEIADAIAETDDGSYLVIGDSLWKFDNAGTLILSVGISGSSIMPTMDGHYVVAGSGGTNFYIIDDSGVIRNTYSTGGGTLEYIRETSTGNYIGIGYGSLTMYDSGGNTTWNTLLGGSVFTSTFEGKDIAETTDGGFVIVGSETDSNWDSQISVHKVSSSGAHLWSHIYGGVNYTDAGESVKATSDGGVVLCGMTNVNGHGDMFLKKLDSTGTTTWSKTYGTSAAGETASTVAHTSTGGYILCGTSDIDGYGTGFEIYVVVTDSEGNELDSDTFQGGSGMDLAMDMVATSDGGHIITGWGNFNYSSFNSDVYLLKLNY